MTLPFHIEWINSFHVNEAAIEQRAARIREECRFSNPVHEAAWLLKAITLIDLTTLSGDDTLTNVNKLCCQAAFPIPNDIIKKLLLGRDDNVGCLTTAAVCVYPSRVNDAVKQLKLLRCNIPVASVATGFPSGLYPLETRLKEIEYCVSQGAKEVDIVLDRSLVLAADWEKVYNEVKAMREACGDAHLKAILATGECGSLENVAKASIASIMAGAHFIKTSTGKEAVNATLEFGLVMCAVIRFIYDETGIKIGLKPAGGLKTTRDALQWLYLVKTELGVEWLEPNLFRIGASSLLKSIVMRLSDISSKLKINIMRSFDELQIGL